MNKNFDKLTISKIKYYEKLYNKTYKIVSEQSKKTKLLNKEKEILTKYKNSYYININKYLNNNEISFSDLISEIKNLKCKENKNNENNKENNKNNKNKEKKENNKNNKNNIIYPYYKKKNNVEKDLLNLSKIYKKYKKKLNNEIKILDNIILKNNIKHKIKVFRGISHHKEIYKTVVENITKCAKKIGNTITIKMFQSTSINIETSLGFMGLNGIMLEIDTNGFPYYYLPWEQKKNIKKEMLSFSEYELLLPRNIIMKYMGQKTIKNKNIIKKNWKNYEKSKKGKTLKDIIIFKFKIVDYNKDDKPPENQNNLKISINNLKKLYLLD